MIKTYQTNLNRMSTQLLKQVAEKVFSQERISNEEALELLELKAPNDLEELRFLADWKRKQLVQDEVIFASTFYIHPTNLCELNCPLCSFYAKPGWKKAWFNTPQQIENKLKSVNTEELTEIHIVGGLWRECNLDYYQELFQRIKAVAPQAIIKALTPVEYDFLANMHGISVEQVLEKMIGFGLNYLPGGGAEILVEEVRKKIAPGKISSDRFLEIHRIAHRMGLSSNITMLFDHIEENHHIVTHLSKVRELQDETQGFKAFIPLKFGEENNALGKRKKQLNKKNIYLIYAVSRLFLDIKHLKVLWNYVGLETALELLNWGGNDLSSTNVEEKIIKMANSKVESVTIQSLTEKIQKLNRQAKLTNSVLC